jgi:hypothetical protein
MVWHAAMGFGAAAGVAGARQLLSGSDHWERRAGFKSGEARGGELGCRQRLWCQMWSFSGKRNLFSPRQYFSARQSSKIPYDSLPVCRDTWHDGACEPRVRRGCIFPYRFHISLFY